MLPSIIQENFLTPDEIEFIKNFVFEHGDHYDDRVGNDLHGYYKTWLYYKSKFSPIKQIFDKKFRSILDFDFVVDHSHVLVSQTPYQIHTDYFQHRNYPDKLKPAYTFIIPLANYDSHTLVFEQYSEIKSIHEYIELEKPTPVQEPLTPEFVSEYLTHVDPNVLPYLSLKEIFAWKQGWLHAADRRYFHSSDNFIKRGISSKTAFIFWLSTPI